MDGGDEGSGGAAARRATDRPPDAALPSGAGAADATEDAIGDATGDPAGNPTGDPIGDPTGGADAARRRALLFALGRVAGGDRRALEEVYRLAGAKLFDVCRRILSERADAEEALQDTFLTVWHRASAFDAARGNPMTWLIALARNRAVDRLRARGVGRPGGGPGRLPAEAAIDVPEPGADALAALEASEDEARVEQCLAALPTEDAELIRAAFFGGATYAQLAARDGRPLGTVKSRIRRTLLRLRECLS